MQKATSCRFTAIHPSKCASQDKAFRALRSASGVLPLDPATFEKVDETFQSGSDKRALPIYRGGACGEGSLTPNPQGASCPSVA